MSAVLKLVEEMIADLVVAGMLLTELTGILVLLYTFVKALVHLLRRYTQGKVKLILARGIGLSMEFMLVSEVLHTTISREWKELGILAAVILIRIALTLLLNWEIRNEKLEEEDSLPQKKNLVAAETVET